MAGDTPKLRQLPSGDLMFWCPGCDEPHRVRIRQHNWGWNGDWERPTFTHPVLVCGTHKFTDSDWDAWRLGRRLRRRGRRCNAFITEGVILYLSDCTHALRGQRIDMVPFRESYAT